MKKRHPLTLETILEIPAFLLACALSLVIFAGIQKWALPRAEGPGLLPVYFCCAVFPAFALVFGLGAAIRSRRAEDRPPLQITPVHLMILGTIATLACIAFASWPKQPKPASTVSDPAVTDPASRARALARKAVVQRLSTSGVEGMQLDARQITRDGTPYWRVTTKGAIADYVIDVGEGTRPNAWGEPEPVVDVFDAGVAPPGDVEAPDATAPVSSQ